MISKLRVQNFKSWQDTGEMRLAPLTALFGTNSSGKTALLQLLLMLKQTTESSDRAQALNLGDERTPVELGTFSDLLFAHNLRSLLAWELVWKLLQPLRIENPAQKGRILFQNETLGFSAQVGWSGNGDQGPGRTIVHRIAYHFAGGSFGMHLKAEAKTEYDLFSEMPGFEFVRTRGRPWGLPAPSKCYGFPDQVRAYHQNAGLLSDFELEFEKLFSRLFYLGPLRDYPRRQYAWAGGQPTDMGRRGERVVDALLAARESGAYLSRGRGYKKLTLEERVAKWLKDLGLIEHFEVRPITPSGKLFQVWVQRSSTAPEVLITDVGFGVSQILPVITLCYYAPEGSTLLLEQPEIHLHPFVQAGLADVFIDAIKTRHIQIILESHSEHLLTRLQRRIAEEVLLHDQAALYFTRNENGVSRLDALHLDEYGNITNWPQNFFGDEMGERVAMTEAEMRRRQAIRNTAE